MSLGPFSLEMGQIMNMTELSLGTNGEEIYHFNF